MHHDDCLGMLRGDLAFGIVGALRNQGLIAGEILIPFGLRQTISDGAFHPVGFNCPSCRAARNTFDGTAWGGGGGLLSLRGGREDA